MLKKNVFIIFILLYELSAFSQTTVKKDTSAVAPKDDYFQPATVVHTVKKDTSAVIPADDYYQPSTVLRYEDVVYEKNIKSVQLYNDEFELSQPIIELGSGEGLKLSFDDLDGDLKDYSLTLIHCNASWQPSNLMPLEYIDGFEDIELNNFSYSARTRQNYTHYYVYIPTTNTRITKSGNYLLKVFHREDESKLVLTKRLMVVENKVVIKAKVHPASTIENRNYKQEVDFSIIHDDYVIDNPYQNLKVTIVQNNRPDNAVTTLQPSFINDMQIDFNYEEDNVFSGGSEFRNFDTRSLVYKSARISKINKDSSKINITLLPDERRTFLRYASASDINGNFIIKSTDPQRDSSSINAEYCYVNFFVPYTETFDNGNFYVFGAYNGWKCTKENRMKFNLNRLGYEATIYLKQGYYNYEYVFLENGKTVADETVIEGMHSETENEYTIYVYYKQQGSFYDRLIGIGHINSIKF